MDLDTLRLLIPDTDPSNQIFSDDDLDLFLTLAGGGVFLAAALALETIATDEALIYKIVSTDDLNVNGVTGAAQVLLVRAKTLRTDQDRADANANATDAFNLVFRDDPIPVYPEGVVRWYW